MNSSRKNSLLQKLLIILGFILLQNVSSFAQYYPNYDIPVFSGNQKLTHAWVGGLNNPQFSAADLNNDGVDDLVIFDRTGNKFLTFLNCNISDSLCYTYAPRYELNFPSLFDWALLLDFNCDGIADLFAHTNIGVQVFKGYYNSNNELSFVLFKDVVRYVTSKKPYPNLYVSSVDIPAFTDVDNDGDIDVLTFDILGGYIEYYKNKSKEMGYGCDSLIFYQEDHCFGEIYEPSNSPAKYLNQPCPWRVEESPDVPHLRHSGSTMVALENNSNHTKDLIIGDIGFNDLVFLKNGGDTTHARFISQDTLFPVYSVPVDIPNFPAAFCLDMNNDGLKDIVASPNFQFGSENVANVWYYKNEGTVSEGHYIFQTDSLFTRDMIEVGEGAFAVFAKIDNDTLEDLIVSNRNYYNHYSALAYYKNTGTKTAPEFTLVTKDYLNLSSLRLNGFHPSFGDLDGDGDLDMIIGMENGTLLFYKNIAVTGHPADFVLNNPKYFNINVGNFSTPQIVDVNEDGKMDLLIGNDLGVVYYYENKGTVTVPDFSGAADSLFGGVSVQEKYSITGYSVPFLTKLNGNSFHTLLVGCEGGHIFQYEDIDGNLTGNFALIDSFYAGIRVGSFSTVSGKDINDDGSIELAVGNYRGGVTVYDTAKIHAVGTNNLKKNFQEINVYPNPSGGKFNIKISGKELSEKPQFIITNILGQPVHFEVNESGINSFVISMKDNNQGIYFCRINSNGRTVVCKLLLAER